MKKLPQNITTADYKEMSELLREFGAPNANKTASKLVDAIATGFVFIVSVLAIVSYSIRAFAANVKGLLIHKIEVQDHQLHLNKLNN